MYGTVLVLLFLEVSKIPNTTLKEIHQDLLLSIDDGHSLHKVGVHSKEHAQVQYLVVVVVVVVFVSWG
jgi:hypothetical protein